MLINISELLSTDFKKEIFTSEIEFKTFDLDGESYEFLEKNPVHMTVENEGKSKLHFFGDVDVTFDIPCARCLSSVPTRIAFDFDTRYDFAGNTEESLDESDEYTSFIEENSLDVDKFVYNEILIHFPMKVLCKDDCLGLCLKCGRNLNEGECGCDRESLDPRMSAIRDIFNNFKEV